MSTTYYDLFSQLLCKPTTFFSIYNLLNQKLMNYVSDTISLHIDEISKKIVKNIESFTKLWFCKQDMV